MKKRIAGLSIVMLLLFSVPVYAETALEAVRKNVDRVLEVLRDPALEAKSAKEIKKQKLESLYQEMFDEVELSRRTLSRHWNSFQDSRRREFVHLFRQVLENAYVDKILAYRDEKVVYGREIKLSEDQAEVQTKVVTSSGEVAINYRLIQKEGTWKVYDVIVENVSLVQNYRAQFNSILARNTPEQLLDILRKKVKKNS